METPDRPPLDVALLSELLAGPAGPLRRLEVVASSPSTSSELVAAVAADPAAWPAPALLVAEHQVAGRGRSGRSWETPAGSALTCSLLVRPSVPRETMTWLPLLAGLAAVTALRSTAGVRAAVKWPNDVLVPGDGTDVTGWGGHRKVAGILTELLPDGGAVVGVGLNVTQTPDELPVPSATSLAMVGAATTDRTVLLTALAESFAEIAGRWSAAGGDAVAAGLRDDVAGACATIGAHVRAELSDGRAVHGTARGLAPDGALEVRTATGELHTVHSGDVHHLRLN
ncbi:biotin--[acetyl-CoA-carboxylase] ligase [Sanguibacter suaedae]|uniref:biotin--[biotin carboxyl-carrier protein] ligase n=1 Tax=Sanguibacter suaedae TaxID=2795737 RepID=A0A934M9X4_9MICO|nr:biotin--[acetyl-CoA-carboxylase] ligase [Sanguibacter suaedae]MBI9115138.1 biotin--[acetyl-CoA-carboxylase] ligase [Sanguibacter suaedae]